METYDAALTNGGVITTCLSAGKSDVYNQGVDFFNGQAVYADIVAMGENVPIVEQSDFHYPCRTQVAGAIQNIINGTDTATALKDAQEQLVHSMESAE